ncbi:MAG: DUF4328 domain-containing protein [Pirellula sp.]
MSTIYTFREINGLTKFLTILLGLGAALAVISVLSSLMQAELLSRESFSEAEGQTNDVREGVIGLLQFALYIFTAVIFGRWIVRANRNVRALGAEGLRITPGWALGYFFVPILSLWMPFQAMKDLWRASQNPGDWANVAASSILPAWWTLWLISAIAGQVSLRTSMAAKKLEGLQVATYVQMVSQALDIPLCLVAMALVTQIAKAQHSHVQS